MPYVGCATKRDWSADTYSRLLRCLAKGAYRYPRIRFVLRRLDPPIQLFQPFSQFIPASWASHTVRTVWAVDSQKGQYVADPGSRHHGAPAASTIRLEQ